MMNKKVLVLTLALMVAFAGSAMAATTIGGKVTVTAEQENFKVFQDGYEITPKLEMTIKGSSKDVTEVTEVVETTQVDEETGETVSVLETKTDKVTNWELTSELSTSFGLGKYRLSLYDDYFNAYVWGNKHEFKKKATNFDLISASSGKDEAGHRARLEVPVAGLATLTADFAPTNTMRLFAEGNVEGYDVGLAYARKGWKIGADDKVTATDVIVGQAGGAILAGDYTVNAKTALGVTLGEDLGLAFGLGADTKLTDELKIEGSVTHANKDWKGDDKTVVARNTVLKAGATYEEAAYKATAEVTQTFVSEPTEDEAEKANVIDLALLYRFSETVAYADLFKADKYYTNDAPAVKAFANVKDFGLGEVGVEVAAPVVENMVWIKAYGKYGSYSINDEKQFLGYKPLATGSKIKVEKKFTDTEDKEHKFEVEETITVTPEEKKAGYIADTKRAAKDAAGKPIKVFKKETQNDFKVGADLYIAATDKLTFKPYAYYENFGGLITLGSKADYKIGLSDTVLGFEVKKVMANDELASKRSELIKATIAVSF